MTMHVLMIIINLFMKIDDMILQPTQSKQSPHVTGTSRKQIHIFCKCDFSLRTVRNEGQPIVNLMKGKLIFWAFIWSIIAHRNLMLDSRGIPFWNSLSIGRKLQSLHLSFKNFIVARWSAPQLVAWRWQESNFRSLSHIAKHESAQI